MQITIVQAEIEEAIRAYVLSQLTVRENQQVTIDLKATRGDTGFQAVIDIVPIDQPKNPAVVTAAHLRLKPAVPVQPLTSAPAAAIPKKPFTMQDLKKQQAEEAAAEETAAEAAEETAAEAAEGEGIQEEAGETAEEQTGEDPAGTEEQTEDPAPASQPARASLVKPQTTPAQPRPASQLTGAATGAAPPQKRLFAGFARPNNAE